MMLPAYLHFSYLGVFGRRSSLILSKPTTIELFSALIECRIIYVRCQVNNNDVMSILLMQLQLHRLLRVGGLFYVVAASKLKELL